MICPNCKIEMKNGCCLRCGLLENGNYINHQEVKSKYDEIREYHDDFDNLYHNENWYVPFIFGHLYFSYRNYFILGLIFEILEISLFVLTFYIQSLTIFQDLLSSFANIALTFIISRTILSMIANPIILFFDKKKIKRNKSKFKSKIKLCINIIIDIIIIKMYF